MKTNRSTFSILFYPNTCLIIPIIGLEIMPDDWDNQTGTAKGQSKESVTINKQIEKLRNEISSHYNNMVQ